MLGVPQTCEYSPEENHSSSTELEMHMGVKEQAALSGTADRGRCKAWTSFLRNVSIHRLARRGELQGQLECLAATKEYFIAKGWLPAKHISGTRIASSSWTGIHDEMPISPQTQCKGGWRSQEYTKNSPCKLTRDQQQTPAALGDRKQVRQEGRHTPCPTLLQQLARGETIFFFLPIKFPVPVLFPSKTKRRARHAGFHYEWSCTTLWREWENLGGVQEPRQRLPLSFLSGMPSELTGVWI